MINGQLPMGRRSAGAHPCGRPNIIHLDEWSRLYVGVITCGNPTIWPMFFSAWVAKMKSGHIQYETRRVLALHSDANSSRKRNPSGLVRIEFGSAMSG